LPGVPGRVGVLTSGGDAPGMNAAVRAVVRVAAATGTEVVGMQSGYRGLMDGDVVPLNTRAVAGILGRGGTVLGTARPPEFHTQVGQRRALAKMAALGIDGLVVIGGNGSQTGALALHRHGVPVVGVASTVDNDLAGVDTSIGVDTALNTALALIDRLRDTASSHHRAFVIEVMGRHSGYLALMAGIAAGADLIVTPERPVDVAEAEAALRAAYAAGKAHFIVVVAEGSPLRAVGLAARLEELRQGAYEVRLSVLGHVQRGGVPTAFDRLLATRSAALAPETLLAGGGGVMAGLTNGRFGIVPLEDALRPAAKVDPALNRLADVLAQ
jgi:6-phosphofructokinase 1